jgi:hypothetical protein
MPIGEIAVQFPGATAIFRKHKLDYCCGDAISLAGDAFAAKHLRAHVIRLPGQRPGCDREILWRSLECHGLLGIELQSDAEGGLAVQGVVVRLGNRAGSQLTA